jgi:uncharacterized protein YkwD
VVPLRQIRIAAVATIVTAAVACSAPAPADREPDGATRSPSRAISSRLVDLTNIERTRAGLDELRPNAALDRAARIQADQLAAAGRLDHTVRGADYPRLEDRLAAAGYAWRTIGENLAFGQGNVATAIETWMRSDSHRANILNGEFTEVGAAQSVDRNGRPYYVQVFARPSS